MLSEVPSNLGHSVLLWILEPGVGALSWLLLFYVKDTKPFTLLHWMINFWAKRSPFLDCYFPAYQKTHFLKISLNFLSEMLWALAVVSTMYGQLCVYSWDRFLLLHILGYPGDLGRDVMCLQNYSRAFLLCELCISYPSTIFTMLKQKYFISLSTELSRNCIYLSILKNPGKLGFSSFFLFCPSFDIYGSIYFFTDFTASSE